MEQTLLPLSKLSIHYPFLFMHPGILLLLFLLTGFSLSEIRSLELVVSDLVFSRHKETNLLANVSNHLVSCGQDFQVLPFLFSSSFLPRHSLPSLFHCHRCPHD